MWVGSITGPAKCAPVRVAVSVILLHASFTGSLSNAFSLMRNVCDGSAISCARQRVHYD